ncbi:nucleotide pyrophosphohydrolase [Baekduia sp.]|uniref:nucleotide pyrophosphohydrolase n=1 Tax=Baekduia sp. TaxID=2600305 RepID=UPI002E0B9A6C|nr:nucleotide pyrophosphohydrolase [Baekduia sp.]
MSIVELQRQLALFRDARDWLQFHSPKNLSAAIAVEAAELQELFLWSQTGGAEVLADRRQAVEDELADVLIQCLNFANATGIDVEAAVRRKIADNGRRYPAEKARGSAAKWTELDDE